MSFFDPVYSNGHVAIEEDEENDLLADGIPRPSLGNDNQKESHVRSDIDIVLEQSSDVKYSIKLSLLLIMVEF